MITSRIKRQILEIDESKCNGCGLCIPSCAEGALRLENGKLKIIADQLCDGLGNCLGNCPRGALSLVEKEVAPYNHAAVEAALGKKIPHPGCPGTLAATATPENKQASKPENLQEAIKNPGSCGLAQSSLQPLGDLQNQNSKPSALSGIERHWPLKLHLLPVNAPYMQGAKLLLTSDCSALAGAKLVQDLLPGRVALLLCPKLENKAAVVDKLRLILQHCQPESIDIVRMEVPCCCLPELLQQALESLAPALLAKLPINVLSLSRFGQAIAHSPLQPKQSNSTPLLASGLSGPALNEIKHEPQPQ